MEVAYSAILIDEERMQTPCSNTDDARARPGTKDALSHLLFDPSIPCGLGDFIEVTWTHSKLTEVAGAPDENLCRGIHFNGE